jgi:hypothetical protein
MSKKATITNPGRQEAPPVLKKGVLSPEDRVSYIALGVILLLIYLIRSNFFEIPFERDEGAYGYYGKLLLHGKIPYIDFYEQKFPGIFYFYALMVGIFGDTVSGMHIGFMLLNMATVVLLFFASKRMFSGAAGVIAAATYAIVSMTPNLSGFTIQGEHGVAFFVSLGLFFYSLTLSHRNWYYYFLMGLAMGTAFMVKTSGVFLVFWGGIALIIDFIFYNGPKTVKEFLKRVGNYSIAGLLVIGIFFLLIALKGSFDQMIYWSIEIPKRYVSRIKWEDGKKYLEYTYDAITKDYKFFWMHAGLAILTVFVKSIHWRLKLTMLLLLAFSVGTIFPGFYFYGHYWIQILPGLSLVAAFTAYSLITLIGTMVKFPQIRIKYAYLILFGVVLLAHLNKKKDYYFNPNYDLILRNVYGNNPFPETARIAQYIKANSTPSDNIVSIGSEPEIYFYTQKNCPSRHAYFSAIVDNVAEHKVWQREFVADVEKAKPRYIIFYNHPISLMVQPGTDRYIWDWYDKYIKDYQIVGVVEMVEGYVNANYYWKEQLANYKQQSQMVIYVYERKPEVAAPAPGA